MSDAIAVALITGIITLTGTVLSTLMVNRKTQTILEYKIEELCRDVRKHNNFAERIPVIEEKVANLEKNI